jgi:hypothetical protein
VSGTPLNENHDAVTLRLHNKGIGMLRLQGLGISNGAFFKIDQINGVAYTSGKLPLTIGSGAYADVRVRFVAVDPPVNNGRVKVLTETLTITTNDPTQPTAKVTLRGLWQKYVHGNNEPYVAEMLGAFGLGTQTGYAQTNTKHDAPVAGSDEIFSSYFVRADGGKPVAVRQLAAYHNCCQTTDLSPLGSQGGLYRGRRPAAPRRRGRAKPCCPARTTRPGPPAAAASTPPFPSPCASGANTPIPSATCTPAR